MVNGAGANSVRDGGMAARSRAPVFVIGCPRSGTNLLYDCLLSSGGFAIFRGRIPIHQVLIPRFGKLDSIENRKKIVSVFLRSEGFRRSGLNASELTQEILESGRTGGDFLRIVMEEIARHQNAPRWALYDPEMLVRMSIIKREIPKALFIHIVRDGRDIALSLRKLGGFNPYPWTSSPRSLEETALYWQWLVERGRNYGRRISGDYTEIHFEDLVEQPKRTMQALGDFLAQDLDYERILAHALGTLGKTNSSFRTDPADAGVNPVQRWKQRLTPGEVAALEWQVGRTLQAVGYTLNTAPNKWKPSMGSKILRSLFPSYLDAKLWLKAHTPAGRVANMSKLELEP